MAKIDLHVHSKYSGHPSEWFLKKFGTKESYTEPEMVYNISKQNGMDFVTITDHNSIDGALQLEKKYPDKVIIGCEFTTYFPEDGCKIHLLAFGINEEQFQELNILRENIYQMRDYIRKNKIAHSVAHATYSVNGKLKFEHLEKLILLFDVFEGINGSRIKLGNETWTNVLKSLTPERIDELKAKYNIEPFSDDPWIKGFTGGSDDHAALFIGRTYAETEANTKEELLGQLRNKKTKANGRNNDYKSFVFIIYKIIYDFSKSQSNIISKTLINQITAMLFEKKDLSFINWLKSRQMKKGKEKDSFTVHLYELVESLKKSPDVKFEEKFDYIFQKISDIFDDFIKNILKKTNKSIGKGDMYGIIKNISSFLPSIFLSIPFFSSLFHMYMLKPLITELKEKYLNTNAKPKKKILWFTDTLVDINGVSVTIKNIGWLCHNTGRELKIVTALPEEMLTNEKLPPNIINLPFLFDFNLPNYENITLRIPSVLKSIELLYEYEPDEVYISTPGTIGLLGLLYAKLVSAKTVGVFHTDFKEQARRIIGEEPVLEFIEAGVKWFYSSMDRIAVPTKEYIDLLEQRGFERKKMEVFQRGIDSEMTSIRTNYLEKKLSYGVNTILTYAGRISLDKNIDFLIDVFKKLNEISNKIYLVIIGDGPYLKELVHKNKNDDHIIFTGKLNRKELPEIFSLSDIFVFPSNTDTFGMAVLEAQACGLPAVVADIGGPQEIVKNNETGYIVSTDNPDEWFNVINSIIKLKENNLDKYIELRQKSRTHILNNYNWEIVLSNMFEENLKKPEELYSDNIEEKIELKV